MVQGKSGPSLPDTLTFRQKQVLSAIQRFIREKGFPPTVSELAKRLDVSGASIHQHLDYLQRKGYIQRDETSKARGIRVLVESGDGSSLRQIPLLGRIAAGVPIEAIENIDGCILIDEQKLRGDCLYALKVHGDSMILDGILDGDVAIVRSQSIVENGEIAVALIGSEATVKRFYRNADHSVTLKPSNPEYEPKQYRPDDVQVLGKVIGIQRYLE